MDRLVLVANTHRVAPGLLSWPAWHELRSAPVYAADAEHPQLPFLDGAGVAVEILAGDAPAALAAAFRELARGGTAVWLASPGGDPEFVRALGDLVAREGGVEMEVVYGSYDLPGARLLDLVATMDRLRSPGGCPWDAQQTHETLAPYLVEETYEAVEAIETGDRAALRSELGDVLLQVAFHARVAQERTDGTGWSIDDVAAGIVEKLVRRHPHVFGDTTVSGAEEVVHNWERIKDGERDGVFDGIPAGQPALALAAKVQQRALRAGLPAALLHESGDELFALVARLRESGRDPEAALRAAVRDFRARFAAAEETARATGVPLAEWDEAAWRAVWDAAALPPAGCVDPGGPEG